MAHAHAELTGVLGVAMVTAGPGVTNTVTAIANASLARRRVLVIGGCTSRPQANMGPLQDIPHIDDHAPVTRYCAHRARRRPGDPRAGRGGGARDGRHRRAGAGLYRDPDRRAARRTSRRSSCSTTGCSRSRRASSRPIPTPSKAAVEAIWSAKRPLVVTGRGARGAGAELVRLLDASGALYLDTQESRGLVPADHPVGRGRDARRGDERGRSRRRDRPQARLPDRLRLAGRLPGRHASSASPTTPAS